MNRTNTAKAAQKRHTRGKSQNALSDSNITVVKKLEKTKDFKTRIF